MGYFRRYKLTDYTADECRKEMEQLEGEVLWGSDICDQASLTPVLEKWACFRELLARHEKQNQSPLDGQSSV